jgi:hypothetical protein
MLEGLLPRLLPEELNRRYIVFQGKQDLEKQLEGKLRGWQQPDSLFVILRDQDSGDCHEVKSKLLKLCRNAGNHRVLVRVACRELESFYLGDLEAVEKGLGVRGLAAKQNQRKFKAPDHLGSPSAELSRLTGNQYQKVSGSRSIAPHMSLDSNRSHSFNVFLSGIKKLVEDL